MYNCDCDSILLECDSSSLWYPLTMTTPKEINFQKSNETTKNNSFPLPRPIIIESSPLSSPYFQKLPPLSPRSMKMIDPQYHATEDFRRKSPAELSARGSSCSAESTSSSIGSDYMTTSSEVGNLFDFQRKPSDCLESSANDIVSVSTRLGNFLIFSPTLRWLCSLLI